MFHEPDHLKRRLQHESHSTNHKQLFQCLECGKQYNTQLGYRRHLVAAHGTTPTTTAPPTTTTTTGLPCPEGPPSLLEQLGGHIDRPPPSLEGPPSASASTAVRERKYSCERCDRRFYTRKDVRRHAVVHTGRRDFLCPRCAQRFGRRDHLTRHLKKSHAQEGAVLPHHCTPATASPGGASRQCLVKEEASPVASELGSVVSKETLEPQYPRDVYPSYPMANTVPGLAHSAHGGLMQNHHHHHLSTGMSGARHMQPPQPSHHMQTPPQPQPYSAGSTGGRYQHGSTSFPRAEVDSFLLDLQSAPSPHLTVASASTPASPQREVLGEGVVGVAGGDPHLLCRSPAVPSSDLSCAANMDLGPLLGFLPFGLPPYSPHMGMSGLVMSYPPPPPATTTSTAASSPPSSSQAPPPPPAGPFSLFQPPQAHHVSQGQAAVHGHSQLPQAYSTPSMSSSSSLPHYYQAFQQ